MNCFPTGLRHVEFSSFCYVISVQHLINLDMVDVHQPSAFVWLTIKYFITMAC